MAMHNVQQETMTFDSCILCNNDLERPKILHCFHSFCVKCLQKYVKESGKKKLFKCPTCFREIHGSVEHLLDNDLAIICRDKTTTSPSKQTECDSCHEYNHTNRASVRCSECDKYLCGSCVDGHNRFIKGHTMAPLGGVEENPASSRQSRAIEFDPCSIHKKKRCNLFCKTCGRNVCELCKLQQHKNHECITSESANILHKGEIKVIVNEIKDQISAFETMSGSFKDYISSSNENKKAVLQEINKQQDCVIDSVRTMFTQLKNETLTTFSDDHKKTVELMETLKNSLSSLKNTQYFSDKLSKFGQDNDILKYRKMVIENYDYFKSLVVNDVSNMVVEYCVPKFYAPSIKKAAVGVLTVKYGNSAASSKGSKRRASEMDLNISVETSPTVQQPRKRKRSCGGEASSSAATVTPSRVEGRKPLKGLLKFPKMSSAASVSPVLSFPQSCNHSHSFICDGGVLSIAVDPDDQLLVCTDQSCTCYTKTGDEMFKLQLPKSVKQKEPWKPNAVGCTASGEIIVCQLNDSSIYYYNRLGVFLRRKPVQGPKSPNSVLMVEDNILFTDATKQAVFMLASSNLRCIRKTVSGDPKINLSHPCGVAVNSDRDVIFVSDKDLGIFAYDMNFKRKWVKSDVQKGFQGICCDAENNLFIANRQANSIVKFNAKDEKFIQVLSQSDGIQSPTCVVFDDVGNLIVGEESGAIKVFNLAEKDD